MNTSDIIEKYYNLIKEERHFNYKYNPILNLEKKKTNIVSNKKSNMDINIIKNKKNIKISSETKLNWINKKIINKNKKLEVILSNSHNQTQK